VADVQRAGRVRGDELQVDHVAGELLAVTVADARLDDGADQFTGRTGVQDDVQEPRPGHLDALDPGQHAEPAGQQLGDLPRRLTGLLGELHGDVGGPVAVVALLGSLDPHHARNRGSEFALGDGGLQARLDGSGKFVRCHGTIVESGPTRGVSVFLGSRLGTRSRAKTLPAPNFGLDVGL
jgi:hypothetical protein